MLPFDLSVRDNCRAAVARVVAEFGRLDALCNVAGVMLPGRTTEISDADWDLTMATAKRLGFGYGVGTVLSTK